VQGRLIGGCIEVLEMAKQTSIWPKNNFWEDAIMFIETSEDMPEPKYVEYWLRNYGTQGILNRIKGIIWGKPYDNKYYEEYKSVIYKVLNELGLNELPVLYNMNFGHTQPMIVLPYGAIAEINCNENFFSILESGVI
jgi:muramoyltetrapeptide carboxypeptidase LdcA involved in peptidoglycan recycling